jgi:hypothetical protein
MIADAVRAPESLFTRPFAFVPAGENRWMRIPAPFDPAEIARLALEPGF